MEEIPQQTIQDINSSQEPSPETNFWSDKKRILLWAVVAFFALVAAAVSGFYYFKDNFGVKNAEPVAVATSTEVRVLSESEKNQAYYDQARAQFNADFCVMIKNNDSAKIKENIQQNPITFEIGKEAITLHCENCGNEKKLPWKELDKLTIKIIIK